METPSLPASIGETVLNVMYSDTLNKIIWAGAVGVVVLFFGYFIIKYRRLKVITKNSVWLTLFLAFSTLLFASIIQYASHVVIQAVKSFEPQQVTITQLGDEEIFMQWFTDKATFQYIRYRKEGEEWQVALDRRQFKPVTKHTVYIRNLRKGKYLLEIRSSEKIAIFQKRKSFEFILH